MDSLFLYLTITILGLTRGLIFEHTITARIQLRIVGLSATTLLTRAKGKHANATCKICWIICGGATIVLRWSNQRKDAIIATIHRWIVSRHATTQLTRAHI